MFCFLNSEIIANQIARQLINASGPNTGGQVTVKTESWNSRDGIVDKSQKSESWGGNLPYTIHLYVSV